MANMTKSSLELMDEMTQRWHRESERLLHVAVAMTLMKTGFTSVEIDIDEIAPFLVHYEPTVSWNDPESKNRCMVVSVKPRVVETIPAPAVVPTVEEELMASHPFFPRMYDPYMNTYPTKQNRK